MKNFAQSHKKNDSILYFWRGYLLFGIMLLCCILPFCVRTFFLLEENVQSNTQKNIEKGMEILDNEITTLNNVVLDIQSFKYFSYIRTIGDKREPSDYYAFLEMQQKLMDSTKFLSFARDSMLYFPNDLIFFYDNVYTIDAQDSSKRLSTERYGKLENWFDVLDNEKNVYAFMESDKYYDSVDGEFYGIPYVHTYIRATKEENPMLVTIFPVQTLYELWRLQDIQDIADITIYNGASGEVLHSEDNKVTGWSSDITVNSKSSRLRVKVSIPNSYFINQLWDLIMLGVFYILIFLLIAILVSIKLAYKNTERHTELFGEISRWMLREQILNGLDGRQLEEFRERYQTFPKSFRMVIIHLSHTEWSIAAADIKEMLAGQEIHPWFFSKVKPNNFVMLCSLSENKTEFQKKLTRFMELTNQKQDCDCLVAVSLPQSSLEELKEIYQLVLFNMKCFSEKKLIFQEDIEEFERNNFKEPNVLDNIRLTGMILGGEEDIAIKLIKEQWENAKRLRNDSLLKQLFFMQLTILSNVAAKLNYKIADIELSSEDNISVIEAKMIMVTEQLCAYVNEKKDADKNDISKNIIKFINENYCNPDFYMATLVDEFRLSDKTIAKLIKGYQNMTFSEYVEELRLKKACTLLDDSTNNIRDVANASGFNSENTFFKAFKRKYGITPSNYRNNKKL